MVGDLTAGGNGGSCGCLAREDQMLPPCMVHARWAVDACLLDWRGEQKKKEAGRKEGGGGRRQQHCGLFVPLREKLTRFVCAMKSFLALSLLWLRRSGEATILFLTGRRRNGPPRDE